MKETKKAEWRTNLFDLTTKFESVTEASQAAVGVGAARLEPHTLHLSQVVHRTAAFLQCTPILHRKNYQKRLGDGG